MLVELMPLTARPAGASSIRTGEAGAGCGGGQRCGRRSEAQCPMFDAAMSRPSQPRRRRLAAPNAGDAYCDRAGDPRQPKRTRESPIRARA
jgi:hypothetical protein